MLIDALDNLALPLSEFELLRFLEQSTDFFASLADQNSLFKKHFWLFHCLYNLKDYYNAQQQTLSISTLSINLVDHTQAQHNIDTFDPLTEFYLDLNNINLSEEQIAEMQKQFWQRYIALDKKADAIKTLELEGVKPLNLILIKKKYKELAGKHHPDKGSDAEKFAEIKSAFEELSLLF
jgi:hypothetical protein